MSEFHSDYKPSEGFATIEEEHEARTRKAFADGKADYVVIYSRHQGFQMEGIAYCQTRGWVDGGTFVELDEQSSEYRFRLTEEGKRHFGL
ncbi:MAG TPA: hypothetical protein VFW94_24195 [Candidatus Acidoferrales bacterium]|nr:hypothetical protein [Candidatus Acidoferrales bacterium]